MSDAKDKFVNELVRRGGRKMPTGDGEEGEEDTHDPTPQEVLAIREAHRAKNLGPLVGRSIHNHLIRGPGEMSGRATGGQRAVTTSIRGR